MNGLGSVLITDIVAEFDNLFGFVPAVVWTRMRGNDLLDREPFAPTRKEETSLQYSIPNVT